MSQKSCPRCGFDLERLTPIESGRFRYSWTDGFAIDGRKLPLAPKQHEMLGVLMSNNGQLITYQALADRMGGEDWVRPKNSISVLLAQLRRVFEILGVECPIKVVTGRGLVWAPG